MNSGAYRTGAARREAMDKEEDPGRRLAPAITRFVADENGVQAVHGRLPGANSDGYLEKSGGAGECVEPGLHWK